MSEPVFSWVVGGRATAEENHEEICRLYDATFSVKPFVWIEPESAEHSANLVRLREELTFGIALSMIGGRLAGFAYGYRLPVDHGWWDGFPQPLDADVTAEWEGRTFALIDLAVEASYRGQGVGKQLISLLLRGRSEERAVLSVQPVAVRTQEIYRHLGWRKVGRKGPLDDALTPYWDIYLRSLQ
jgi:ribosomal protein S18 acetylase RimI-like enzyme